MIHLLLADGFTTPTTTPVIYYINQAGTSMAPAIVTAATTLIGFITAALLIPRLVTYFRNKA